MAISSSGEALRSIRKFAQLFQYLVDVLGWPLDADDLEGEDLAAITYDWDPEELGIPASRLSDLRQLQQMRPLTAHQPWGVFFLEFAGSRLPITQVRHLLQALVTKRRVATAGLPTWQLDDLLFIVITGEEDAVELNLLAFNGSDPRRAEFLPLAWRPVQSPSRHLNRLADDLLPSLRWPGDDSDVKAWRETWREPFKLPIGKPIKDVARLAEGMAKTARDLRDQITEVLKSEQESGPFSTLMEEIRNRLISDIDPPRFADMCAQTLVYGLLSSRVTNPEGFGSSPIFSTVPLANPFLEAFFEQIYDEAALLDLPGSGLPQLVANLKKTNVEGILDQFGSTVKGGDPVIHFYEEFLKQYDRKLRADAGAFYTPQPVVELMVRMVDEVLRSRFDLSLGIADAAPWREVAQRKGFKVPDGVDPDKPFVSMIDPATGTGTFLIEWIRRARQSFLESAGNGAWPQHLRDHVLPSMHAFELMLAPYTIAHLKAALELHSAGTVDGKVQILLTDTLDHANPQGQLKTMKDPVAEEGERAAALKGKGERFTIVMGNPPYDREHRRIGDTSQRKGGIVRYGVPGTPALIKEIADPMKSAGLGIHLKNIYNDYIYFWRWAVWQAVELPAGPGVVAFITASSYLDGISMGGVRNMLRKAFDELWIIDLGGDVRGARPEENIFEIRTPVAIAVGVRTGEDKKCIVHYQKVGGRRKAKLSRLSEISICNGSFENGQSDKIASGGLDSLIPHRHSHYYDWPKITALFPWIRSGCKLNRTWPIAETQAILNRRWRSLLSEIPRERGNLLRETTDRKIDRKLIPLVGSQTTDGKLPSLYALDETGTYESIERYGYRSFDRQWVIADIRLIDRPGPDLWRVSGPNQIFLTTLTSTKLGHGPIFTVTPYIPDLDHFRGSYGAKSIMPLYRDYDGIIPNASQGLLEVMSSKLDEAISVEDMLAYVYALGGTSAFGKRFTDELAETSGPVCIPITADYNLFDQAVTFGRDLLWWHTWGERFLPEEATKLPLGRTLQIKPVDEMPESFTYSRELQELSIGTGVFGPVNQEVWDFEVSGHKVLQKWLGYRMKSRSGKKSSPLDNIRPDHWTQTDELLRLLSILDHTVKVSHLAANLLEEIVSSPLILADDLPDTPVG